MKRVAYRGPTVGWGMGCYRDSARRLGGAAVPNVTAHLSTASAPITVLLHNGALLCGSDAFLNFKLMG